MALMANTTAYIASEQKKILQQCCMLHESKRMPTQCTL